MHLRLTFLLLLLAAAAQGQLPAWAQTINHQDSSVITAGAVDATGNLYVASLARRTLIPGHGSLFALYQTGDPVVCKWSADGALLWRREFPGNIARITSLDVAADQSIIVTGAYNDVLQGFGAPSDPTDFLGIGLFTARLDPEGTPLWRHTEAGGVGSYALGWKVAVAGNRVYMAGQAQGFDATLTEYDLATGAIVRQRTFANLATISDLEIEPSGAAYLVGSTAPGTEIDGLITPETDPATGYTNYVLAIDSTWTARWARATPYITFDHHAQIERLGNRLYVLSNDFDHHNTLPSYFRVRAYSLEGDTVASFVSLETSWLLFDVLHTALEAACGRLYLVQPAGITGGMALTAYDADLQQEAVLMTSTDGDFDLEPPFLSGGAGRLALGTTFFSPSLTTPPFATLPNDDAPLGRQALFSFPCATTTRVTDPLTAGAALDIFPNPASVQVTVRGAGAVDVFDALGNWKMSARGSEPFPVDHLPAGVYWVQLRRAGKAGGGRLVKF